MTGTALPRLRVETREIDPVADLLEYADRHAPLAWLRRGDGIVALAGASAVYATSAGPAASPHTDATRAARLAGTVSALRDRAEIDDPLHLPGTGLVAFGAFAFDEGSSSESTLTVPSMVVGRHRGRSWVTRMRVAGDTVAESPVQPTPYAPYWAGTLGPGSLGPDGYQDAVRAALDAIAAGEIGKVVLARDIVGSVPAGADLRRLARALSTGYPDTWMYAVDGIIGASPETLVTVSGGTATARVLAGTAPRGADADTDGAASVALATSPKDLDEHEYAVQSVLAALRPYMRSLAVSEQPFTLKLPNVWHLATDAEGELADHATALDLVAAMHPTAAVAGTPTDAALEAIRRLEPFDRGRYAGPVGWVDANGDGEWAIALRCAQFGAARGDSIPIVAHAGAGIVAGSDPETELLETRVKFRPIVEALA